MRYKDCREGTFGSSDEYGSYKGVGNSEYWCWNFANMHEYANFPRYSWYKTSVRLYYCPISDIYAQNDITVIKIYLYYIL